MAGDGAPRERPDAAGDGLLAEAKGSLETLRALLEHSSLLGKEASAALRATADQVEERLARTELHVLVVGEQGAGKSTFLDAIVGNRDLSPAWSGSKRVTLLRRSTTLGYVARFRTGQIETFAGLCPDRSEQIAQTLSELEARSDELANEHAAGEQRLEQVQNALSQSEAKREVLRFELQTARSASAEAAVQFAAIEADRQRADARLREVERSLPAPLRRTPPWWAFWLWILRAFAFFIFVADWRRYAAERRQLERVGATQALVQARASELARAAQGVVERLDPLDAQAAALHEGVVSERRALAALDAERNAAGAELAKKRVELERARRQRRARFASELWSLSDPAARGRDLIDLSIAYPSRLQADDIAIIDAPGLTSADRNEQTLALAAIRDQADGCILVTELEQALLGSTLALLSSLREVVPHVLLVFSKVDHAYLLARQSGARDPWAEVERARRVGTRRFAREVGRAPDEIWSIAVAARAALEDPDSGLARQFESELEKLFQLLRHERALIVGTRVARALRACIAASAQAEADAEQAHQQRIAKLEAERLPEPDVFRRQEVEQAEPAIERATQQALGVAESVVSDQCILLRTRWAGLFSTSRSSRELAGLAAKAERELADGLAESQKKALAELERSAERSARAIEEATLDALRKRYRLPADPERRLSAAPRLPALELSFASVSLALPVRAALSAIRRRRLAFGALGAVLGAAGGVLPFGHWGALGGAALGALASLVPRRTEAIRRATEELERIIGAERERLVAEIRLRQGGARETIRRAVDRALEDAINRYGRRIAEPLDAERHAIELEYETLTRLQELAQALEGHDQKLDELMTEAREASVSLCR
jgi:hypothetical protein